MEWRAISGYCPQPRRGQRLYSILTTTPRGYYSAALDWSLWDVIWTSFVFFCWIAVLVIFIQVVIDIFRSHDLTGWAKAGWTLFVIVLPLIGVLVYMIARPAMEERSLVA